VAATEDTFDPFGRDVVANVGLMHGASQVILLKDSGEVDEGSGSRGHWNPTPRCAIYRLSATEALSSHAANPSLGEAQNFWQ
jgi:hypothetical protein